MSAMAPHITSIRIVCSTVYSGADQRKHQSCASLSLVRGIHRWPVNSSHKGPVTRKMFSFDDVIMWYCKIHCIAVFYVGSLHFFVIIGNVGKVVKTLQHAINMGPRHSRIITRKQGAFVNNLSCHLHGIKHNFSIAYKVFYAQFERDLECVLLQQKHRGVFPAHWPRLPRVTVWFIIPWRWAPAVYLVADKCWFDYAWSGVKWFPGCNCRRSRIITS